PAPVETRGPADLPTAAPPPTAAPAPVAAPASLAAAPVALGPASLTALAPPSVKRHATGILDLHGDNLRADHRAEVLGGREAAKGISGGAYRLVSPSLLQVVILVEEGAAPGPYTISLADAQGAATNPLRFEVAK